jgi:hypothetical protein
MYKLAEPFNKHHTNLIYAAPEDKQIREEIREQDIKENPSTTRLTKHKLQTEELFVK